MSTSLLKSKVLGAGRAQFGIEVGGYDLSFESNYDHNESLSLLIYFFIKAAQIQKRNNIHVDNVEKKNVNGSKQHINNGLKPSNKIK